MDKLLVFGLLAIVLVTGAYYGGPIAGLGLLGGSASGLWLALQRHLSPQS